MTAIVPFEEWTIRGKWRIGTGAFSSPAIAVVFHHSVTRLRNPFILMVTAIEEIIYKRRFRSGFSMVAYNFIITPDGTIWEGRGVRWRNGANTRTKVRVPYRNTNTISICFAGNFHPGSLPVMQPTPEALQAAADLVVYLRREGHLAIGHDFVPHSLLAGTECCGDELRADIPTIRHLSNNPGDSPMELHIPLDPTSDRYADVTNRNDGNVTGRLYQGMTYFETTSFKHWLGVKNVTPVADAHLPTVWAGWDAQMAQMFQGGSTNVGPSAASIADRVIAEIRKVWK